MFDEIFPMLSAATDLSSCPLVSASFACDWVILQKLSPEQLQTTSLQMTDSKRALVSLVRISKYILYETRISYMFS